MDLVTIKTFDGAIEAHILQARFEADGIKCFIFDENIVTMNPLYNIAVGGIKLKINRSDSEKALEIIQEIQDTPTTNENGEIVCCPNCQSRKLYTNYKSMKGIEGFISIITSFVLAVFISKDNLPFHPSESVELEAEHYLIKT